jgi:hypothetical protein
MHHYLFHATYRRAIPANTRKKKGGWGLLSKDSRVALRAKARDVMLPDKLAM